MSRSRNFCFTDFDCIDWVYFANEFEHKTHKIRYIKYGIEECPTTKKLHHQGWIQWEKPVTLRTCKKLMCNEKIHLEICKGNETSNDKYCGKDGKSYEYGKWEKQGKRNDLIEIKDQLLSGEKTIEDIMIEKPVTYCKYRNGLKDIAAVALKRQTKEFRKIEVIALVGDTETGKTREAMESAEYKIEGGNLQWWDGYNGEKTICIDEYDSQIPITQLLNLLDGYQLRLSVKGSFTYANWNKVYITSNVHPEDWHPNAKPEHRAAMLRRITTIKSFHKNAQGIFTRSSARGNTEALAQF